MKCPARIISLPWAAAQMMILRHVAPAHATFEGAAVAKVSAVSSAGAAYFEYETSQLTDGVIERLRHDPEVAEHAGLFDFDHGVGEAQGGHDHHHHQGRCKVFPGDDEWPSQRTWDRFARLLGDDALIPTIPLAAPCYPDRAEYSAAKCEDITARWSDAYLHESDPTSVMWPLWQGRTCLPVNPHRGNSTATCALGGYPAAAVNASTVAQVQLAVNFARRAGLRLVIKNTGHCFLGKSAGAGALSIWLHNLGDIAFLPRYREPGGGDDAYVGKAVKVGPAVTVLRAYEFAHQHDVSVLGGIAESVGFGGGYLQGGGHTPLSGLYGMAADQILAFEVVTADGRFVTASRGENADLFWALRGGGGGTFGVVTSTIVRAHPKLPVVTSFFSFETSDAVSAETFFAGLRAYLDLFIEFTDAHTYGYFYVTPSFDGRNFSSYRFEMVPFFAPNHTIASFEALVAPLFARLAALHIPFSRPVTTTQHDAFLPAFRAAWTQGPVGTYVMPANRLFPRSSFASRGGNFNRTFAALRAHLEKGRNIVGYHQAPRNRLHVDNAVPPAWRHAVAYLITEVTADSGASPAEVRALQRHLDQEVMPPWRAVAPAVDGGGAYLNEANPMEQNWQTEFYGEENYARLLRVKRRRDPRDLFYATTAVGSESWEVRSEATDGVLTQNGRLCRV